MVPLTAFVSLLFFQSAFPFCFLIQMGFEALTPFPHPLSLAEVSFKTFSSEEQEQSLLVFLNL